MAQLLLPDLDLGLEEFAVNSGLLEVSFGGWVHFIFFQPCFDFMNLQENNYKQSSVKREFGLLKMSPITYEEAIAAW